MIRGANGALARALEFQQESMRLVGAEVAAIPERWVARMPSLPLVWSLNHVEVTVPIEARTRWRSSIATWRICLTGS